MATLERLTNLVHLDMRGQAITNAGLPHLKRLTKLEYLNLLDTRITPSNAIKLTAALPHCRIVFGSSNNAGAVGPLEPLPDK